MPSWMGGMIVQACLDWILGQLKILFAVAKKAEKDHQAAIDQAAKDNEKATKINESSSSDEVDAAISDSMRI
jgi:hypothetical protein